MLTVLILAAGYGRRMGPFSRMVNKGLIPYDNKPLISHIMEKFDHETKFVIACGHMGQQVKDYVGAVHSDKQVVYVDIPDYAEGSTGPATTIQLCAEHINSAFIWLSCDTLFDFDYKNKLDHNWIGVHPVNNDIAQDYCWVRRDGETITEIKNKQPSNQAVDAFIGLMYCKDMQYVENLRAAGAKEAHQGLLSNLKLRAHTVREWKDFGMRHDRRGWFLSESSGRNRIMDAQRAFGSPKLVEYSVSDATGGAAQLGPDNVISPVGSVHKSQRINTKKARK